MYGFGGAIVSIFSSCTFPPYSRTNVELNNCTDDTLFIGISFCDDFDRIECIVHSGENRNPISTFDTATIFIDRDKVIKRYAFIYPDSPCYIHINTHLYNNNDTFYFFLVKKGDIIKCLWDEIRSKKLYRKCIVTKDKNGEFDRNIRYQD